MSERIDSEMVANVWKVLVQPGDSVKEGDTLMILESMKMEIPIEAEEAGTVGTVHAAEGTPVTEGDPLITLD